MHQGSVTRYAGRRVRLLRVAAALFACALGLALATPADAAYRNFAQRFATNEPGDIDIVGNTIMSCPIADVNCANARARSGVILDDGSFNMVYVDVDADPTTINSSSATLDLPNGATVLYAGLYWGGFSLNASRNTVKFATPVSGGYNAVVASDVDDSISSAYQGVADVTAEVTAGGDGEYTVADVQASLGIGTYGGWALIVAYRDSTQQLRNLTIYDGFQEASSSTVTLTANGFTTPTSGLVSAIAGVVNYEGDAGIPGDTMSLEGTNLFDTLNPAANFFNGTIEREGVDRTAKNPDYNNQIGFDIDMVDATGLLSPGSNSAQLDEVSTGDILYPGALTLAIELLTPDLTSVLTATDINGGNTVPGDVVEYSLVVTNVGQDDADSVDFTHAIPAGMTYVPGSLNVTAGANAGPMSDAAGDDQAEYAAGNLTFRLGVGANAAAGGTLASGGSTTTVTYLVTVDGSVPHNTVISDQIQLAMVGATSGVSLNDLSNQADVTIWHAPDLRPDLVHSGNLVKGQSNQYTVSVNNDGNNDTSGLVTVDDTLPAGVTPTGASGTGWTCGVVAQAVTCTRNDAVSGGDAYPPIAIDVDVLVTAVNPYTNTVTVTNGDDIDHSNDSDSDIATVDEGADFVPTLTHSGQLVRGADSTYTIGVPNNGAAASSGTVSVIDTFPAGVTPNSASGTGWSCVVVLQIVTCDRADALAAGASYADVTVAVSVGMSATDPYVNSVTVAGGGDADASNNTAIDSGSVIDGSDLQIALSASAESVYASNEISYTAAIYNSGPIDSSSTIVTITIPDQVAVTSLVPSQGTCEQSGQTITCDLGVIPVGLSASIAVVGDVADGVDVETLLASASVASTQTDPDASNNAAQNATPVLAASAAEADVVVSATRSTEKHVVGKRTVFYKTVTNRGPYTATDVQLTESVEGTLRLIHPYAKDASCTTEFPVTCSIGTLKVGESKRVAFIVRPLKPGTLDSTARVTASQTDPVSNNNRANTERTIGNAPVGLRIGQTPSNVLVHRGDVYTYTTKVQARGWNPAYGARVCAFAPQHTSIVDAHGGTVHYGGFVCWRRTSITQGEDEWTSFELTVKVDDDAPKVLLPSVVSANATNAKSWVGGYRVIRVVGLRNDAESEQCLIQIDGLEGCIHLPTWFTDRKRESASQRDS
jgi:uncharacterized repeat protein (TIGR01451 family)